MLRIILISFLFLSCNQKDDSAEPDEYAAKFIAALNTSDTFRYEFPKNRNGLFDSSLFNSKSKFEKLLKLKSLDKSIDSIEIRVIYECVMSSDFLMIILNHNKQKWTAEVSRIKKHFNIELEKVDSFSRKVRFDKPKSGWKEFISKLFDLKILSIENENIIPKDEYSSASDGCGIDFEIATKNVYRIYGYNNPDTQNQKLWQVSNVNAIKEFLYEEFEVLRRWDEQIEVDELREREIRLKEINGKIKNKKPTICIHELSDTVLPQNIK